MPFSNIGTLACQNLQVDLVDYFGQNSPEFRTLGSLAFLRWLLSPQNRSGFTQIDPGRNIPGKKRGIAFRMDVPYCYEIARKDRLCTVAPAVLGQNPSEIVFDLTADPYRPVSGVGDDPSVLRISLRDIEQYCTLNDYSWIQKQIFMFLQRFELEISREMLSLMEPLIGNNIDGDPVTNLPFWVQNSLTNGLALNPEAQFAMDQTFSDIGYDGQYAIIGGRQVNKIRQFLRWACCDGSGVDMSKQNPDNPLSFYDRNADAILGQKDMLLMAPGAAQIVTWNRYAVGSSKRSEVTDLYSNGTIVLPETGLPIDWKWRYDYDCEIWTFEPMLYAELAVVPSGGCLPAGVAGINNTLRIHDCTPYPVIPACPETPEA
jgi:hypothetical protein